MNLEIIPVTHFQQNCSLLYDKNRNGIVIDAGGDVDKILARINELEVSVKYILLTHGHLDHVGGAVQLSEKLNVEIWGSHQDDKFWFDSLSQQAEYFGLPETKPFYPHRWLNEGDTIKVGDIHLETLHLAGHTPGHVGFIEKKYGVAFTGDVLFAGSIGRTDFPRGDLPQLLSSIKQKLYPLGDEMVIVAGHGACTTIGEERQHNPFLQNN